MLSNNESRAVPSTTAEIERQLLAALCARGIHQQTRIEILDRLRAHAFADPDHEVIFQALSKMPPATIEQIRETLGARLTLLGFPDIDFARIFNLEPPSAEQIPILLTQLGC